MIKFVETQHFNFRNSALEMFMYTYFEIELHLPKINTELGIRPFGKEKHLKQTSTCWVLGFKTPLEHTPRPIPRGHTGIPFIVEPTSRQYKTPKVAQFTPLPPSL